MEPVQSLPPTAPQSTAATESRLDAIAALLKQVAREPHTLPDGQGPSQDANELVQVRLGVASALFTALKVKHAPTASHSLRVAVACSSWAALLELPSNQRDEIEIAALLHDIGKIGIPDRILLKPGQLSTEELQSVGVQRQMGVEILRSCCSSPAILDTVLHGGDWYDGRREGQTLSGDSIPLGARMLAIVDAFDAMTTDQVYRRAMSRERATAELFEFAGAQFDPALVKEFCTFLAADQGRLHAIVGRRWLNELSAESVNDLWNLGSPSPDASESSVLSLFHIKLLESMHDAVVFVDDALRIVLWNRAAELLTGMSQASLRYKQWSPSLVNLRDERQKLISDEDDPVVRSVQTADPMLRRFSLAGRNGQRAEVDLHLIPVTGNRGGVHGALLLLRDASSQVSMEQRLKTLHEKATRDPLTQAANRAEFDRALESAVHSHLPKNLPCSLIVADIDHFKRINDNFGHQAGDNILVSFTQLLKSSCRPGDLVVRYGGEEFVLLCPDCDNTTATHRADRIRVELERTPQLAINSQTITASFGVTELQHGDTPETFFRRADRALYQAKENGRNLVVQLGTGIAVVEADRPKRRGWFSWFRSAPPPAPTAPGDLLLSACLATAVPLNLASEKLKGFVSDHHAAVDDMGEHHHAIRIEGENLPLAKRESDRTAPFVIEVRLEQVAASAAQGPATRSRTLVHVEIRPLRARDRRQRDALERARQLFASLKAYLVAQEIDPAQGGLPEKTSDDVQKTVAPWWGANV